MIHLHHLGLTLTLHPLARGEGLPLLLLHELGGSAAEWRALPVEWDGPVYALDFSGHGTSQRLVGGGYSAELFAADADTALARVGDAAVAGRGLGAWVALLLASARADAVPAALLLDGAGLAGGGAQPDFSRGYPLAPTVEAGAGFDSLALAVESVPRPPEYALELAGTANRLLLAEGAEAERQPPWWQAVRRLRQAQPVDTDLGEAFRRLAEACD